MHPRFPFLPDSTGDRLLRHANKARLTFYRYGRGEDAQHSVEFQLEGELQLSGDTRQLVNDLAREFRRPRPTQDLEGGAA